VGFIVSDVCKPRDGGSVSTFIRYSRNDKHLEIRILMFQNSHQKVVDILCMNTVLCCVGQRIMLVLKCYGFMCALKM